MIKLTGISVEGIDKITGAKIAKVSLSSDTKDEVVAIGDDGSTVDGLSAGDKMTLGSTCLCATGDFGILNSSGVWTF